MKRRARGAEVFRRHGWSYTRRIAGETACGAWRIQSELPGSRTLHVFITGSTGNWRIIDRSTNKTYVENLKSLHAAKITWLILFGGD